MRYYVLHDTKLFDLITTYSESLIWKTLYTSNMIRLYHQNMVPFNLIVRTSKDRHKEKVEC